MEKVICKKPKTTKSRNITDLGIINFILSKFLKPKMFELIFNKNEGNPRMWEI